jgi:3,4-dihydroxy 2-butanone 4-phosphate synthase/GTP cyclohydrolase II
LRSKAAGVLKRAGHTEAAVDLTRMAGLQAAAVLCELVSEDKTGMARGADLVRFADTHRLDIISVADIVRHRLETEQVVVPKAEARLPTRYGDFMCRAWVATSDGVEHISLVCGAIRGGDPVLVRVHSECLTGDVLGSERCDCGAQVDDALRAIATAGRGVFVYLRGHEGRGVGLGHKLAAYNIQDSGLDTVDANLALGLSVDSREYGIGAQILHSLGVERIRLMTNNPQKYTGLSGYGLAIVERVPLPPRVTPHNVRYLETKHERMGHLFHADELHGFAQARAAAESLISISPDRRRGWAVG